MHARLLGTLLSSVLTASLTVGLASTAVLGGRLDDGRTPPAAPPGAPPGDVGAVPAVDQATDGAGHGVRGVQTPLSAASLRAHDGATGVVRPGHFTQVAVTWHGSAPSVRVSTRTGGTWTGWRTLEVLDDLDIHEGDGTRGTQLLVVGSSDAVRARITGRGASDLKLVTIDPGTNDALALAAASVDPAVATSSPTASSPTGSPVATTSTTTSPTSIADPLPAPPAYTPPSHYAPHPAVHSRAEWGANESLRKDPPEYNQTMRQVHVHHTVSSNTYTKDSVPKLIRGMYWYHTQSLGWNDIGYNFLIDRFGRLWRGRAGGGIDAPVRGAHTLGFNYNSVGVSLIGNFETAAPSKYAVTTLVRFAAWKADYWRLKPSGWTYVVSEGSDKYAAGTRAYLPVIDGHRHTNDTACPGRYLFAKLPEVRTRAQKRADYY